MHLLCKYAELRWFSLNSLSLHVKTEVKMAEQEAEMLSQAIEDYGSVIALS